MDIKEQLLDRCTEMFDSVSQLSSEYGNPLQVFYIDYGSGEKQSGDYQLTRDIETYRYSAGVLMLVKPGMQPQLEPISGMHYHEGHASIGIDKNGDRAFIDYIVGPRYGRGYEFPITDVNGQKQLGQPEIVWVS